MSLSAPFVVTDLDQQVEADPSLLDEYLRGEEHPRPPVHSHSSYSSVVITRRPDGVGIQGMISAMQLAKREKSEFE